MASMARLALLFAGMTLTMWLMACVEAQPNRASQAISSTKNSIRVSAVYLSTRSTLIATQAKAEDGCRPQEEKVSH
jgi:hypothetical protein